MRRSKLLSSLTVSLFLIAFTPTAALGASNFVPYIGATGNVDLGIYNLTTNKVISSTDAFINSLNVGLGGGSVASNISLGSNTLSNNTVGSNNVAIGKNALSGNTQQHNNTAVGFVAIGNSANSGEQNTAIGSQALTGNTTGSYNAALGYRALEANTSGIRNTAIGLGALIANTTGSTNVAVGFSALSGNTMGGSNVALGDLSAANLSGGANVAVGQFAAFHQADGNTALTAANSSIYIGNSSRGFDNNDSNSIVIGTSAIGAGVNKAVIGNSSLTNVYFGSAAGLANTHARTIYSGSATVPGCIVMGDTTGGVGYITLNSGVLTVSSTPPSACQ